MSEKTAATAEDIGKPCVFVDSIGRRHAALITNVFGPQCINVIYINPDENQKDSYGRKTVHATSVMHGGIQQAHGYYWLMPGEERETPAVDISGKA